MMKGPTMTSWICVVTRRSCQQLYTQDICCLQIQMVHALARYRSAQHTR